MTRKGFTLVEMMIVVVVLAILAGIAVMKYIDLRNAALAAQMAQEVRAIQIAAFNYYADKEVWPPDAGKGAVPPGLGPLLPGQLAGSFDRGKYVFDFENFGGDPDDDLNPTMIVGVNITTDDPKLFAKFVHYLGTQSPFFVAGTTMTYLIAGPGGGF
jgi:prepilin-type N-terminal cleavage/methylation domain-containing protein